MLKNVHLKNLALIKEAEIEYGPNLNIMTGETGSGKSIIIGAINVALGEKANKGIIRTGEKTGLVELQFISDDEAVFDVMKENDIDFEDNTVLITRKIANDSSTAKINGQIVTLSVLKKITSLLVDIHGQHDHQGLLSNTSQLDLLDSFGGKSISEVKQVLKEEYDKYKDLKHELQNYNMDKEELEKKIELTRHEINEIETADLKPNEDESLETEFKKLSNSEKILFSINKANFAINDDEKGVLVKIADSLKMVEDAMAYDEKLESIKSILMDIDSLSKDVGRELSHYTENTVFDEERYKEIMERLDSINFLKTKYGNSIENILSYLEKSKQELSDLMSYNEKKELLEYNLKESASKVNQWAKDLSKVRKRTALMLEPLIYKNLKDLNFLNSEFKIKFDKNEKVSVNGFDKIEFMISTNPGEEMKPLAKTASGGELSRIMLAIKSTVAEKDNMPTLIFDEIDTGISGKTAQMVAEKLHFLSLSHQIICITHLPQIAAMGDDHFKIHKSVEDGSTISGIEELSSSEMIGEIASLVGGSEISSAAIVNAKELKNSANNYKENLQK